MTSQSWQTFGVIFGIVVGAITIYYLQRSSSREQQRIRDARDTKIADDTAKPLLTQLADKERVIERRDAEITRLNTRVDQLEDELRRGRGYGDNDAQRQPRNR